MDNPQDSFKNAVLTQMSDLSEMSSESDSKPKAKASPNPPVGSTATLKVGDRLIHVQFGVKSPSSSSASFESPGSASTNTDTNTYITQAQVDDTTKITKPPPAAKRQATVKRQLVLTKENDNPQPRKKSKCCGRCHEFKIVCLEMANNTNDILKRNYQYKLHKKNSKYRAVFYQTFQDKMGLASVPVCVLEYARALYPSPIGK